MQRNSPHILLINPWITDFAAYNFWTRPLGLLTLASRFRENGFQVTFIDCLDCHSKKKRYGDGNFFKTWIEKPLPLKSIPRYYSRYGIPEEALSEKLSSMGQPDVIGVTSGMTYWYPGVMKVIEITRRFFKDVPVVLGGTYATLCQQHAQKHSGADFIISGGGEGEALRLISELAHFDIPSSPVSHPHSAAPLSPQPVRPAGRLRVPDYPAFDLYPQLDFICIATSRGCPLKCTYCASQLLYNGFDQRDPEGVVREIEFWVTRNRINNVAFYDDALLIRPRDHILPILKGVIQGGIKCNFHSPNGLHVREIDEELAALLFKAGFKTLRLGFETSNETTQRETGWKVGNEEFVRSIRNLNRAGYSGDDIGVYLMAGLPGQRVGEVSESIAFVRRAGARPLLVEYSPIPLTPLFEEAKKTTQFDLEKEPLFQNNSILPCQWEGFTMSDFRRLKEEVRRR